MTPTDRFVEAMHSLRVAHYKASHEEGCCVMCVRMIDQAVEAFADVACNYPQSSYKHGTDFPHDDCCAALLKRVME